SRKPRPSCGAAGSRPGPSCPGTRPGWPSGTPGTASTCGTPSPPTPGTPRPRRGGHCRTARSRPAPGARGVPAGGNAEGRKPPEGSLRPWTLRQRSGEGLLARLSDFLRQQSFRQQAQAVQDVQGGRDAQQAVLRCHRQVPEGDGGCLLPSKLTSRTLTQV